MNPDRLRLKLRYDPCDLLDMVLRESPDAAGGLVKSVGRGRIVRELSRSFLDWGYLGETLSLLGERAVEPPNPQSDVDACLLSLANACNRTLMDLETGSEPRQWLSDRGVTDEQIERHLIGVFGGVRPPQIAASLIGHSPRCVATVLSWRPLFGLSGMAKAGGRPHMTYITVPEIEEGRLHNLCLRAMGESLVSKFFFSHGRQMTFNRAHGGEDAVVVEGVFDALALERAGVPNAVGLGSCHVSARHAARLSRFRSILLAFDGDEAGQAGMAHAWGDHGHRFASSVVLPGGLDPDDYLRSGGDPDVFLPVE